MPNYIRNYKKRPIARRRRGYGKWGKRYGKAKRGLVFRNYGPVKVTKDIQPTSLLVKLPYDTGSLSATTTTVLSYNQYYTNDIYDPQVSVGGGQPMGFDQWSALYLNYRVHGVRVEVLCDSASFHGGIVGIYPHSTSAAPGSLADALEYGETKYVMVNNGSRPLRFTKYIRNHALFNVSKQEYNSESDYTGSTAGTSPVASGYVTIFKQAIDGATSTDFDIRAKLTYYVEFFGIKRLSPS